MNRRAGVAATDWQRQLLEELRALDDSSSGKLRIVGNPTSDGDGEMTVPIELDTSEILATPDGLPLRASERFLVRLPSTVFALPQIEVDHRRFLGHAHVLQGTRLCLYLDPSREWHPSVGIAGVLNRLWDWLGDAAAGRFDASSAMYHAVGGVLHRSDGAPTLVIREAIPSKSSRTAQVTPRGLERCDVSFQADAEGLRAPLVRLATGLPLGASSRLDVLLSLLDDPFLDDAANKPRRVLPTSEGFLRRLLASAVRNPEGSPQYFLLAVPHPAGGPHHLLGGRFASSAADGLRAAAATSGVANFERKQIDGASEIEWCVMSDERPEVTTRRDDSRPVNGLLGKVVQIWGCGGLGSWMAEFAARAGAAAITVCDPGAVLGGLLVRQNYGEEDIGKKKAVALGARLKSIRDDLVVDVESNARPSQIESVLAADLIVDATVNNAVVLALDTLARNAEDRPLIAQVATDARSGTLGIANISAGSSTTTPSEVDRLSGAAVCARGDLEAFHSFWGASDGRSDELIPTRGCSVPTFHGSGADMAGIASTLISLIGGHLVDLEGAKTPGTHLVAMPHSGMGPPHAFLSLSSTGQPLEGPDSARSGGQDS